MNLVIFSDSHGKGHLVKRLLEMHPKADMVLFLGDGIGEAELYTKEKGMRLAAVLGNCDGYTGLYPHIPETLILPLEGHRILLTHGHTFGVKGGMDKLIAFAKQNACDIVIYGHTHLRQETYLGEPVGPMYLFNPGSLGQPRESGASFGLLTLTEHTVLFSHGELPY